MTDTVPSFIDEGPTMPMAPLFEPDPSVDDEPTRPMRPIVHIGCYSLTVPQSVAWHSRDHLERNAVRRDIRRACRNALDLQRLEDAMPIRDVDGTELERVTSVDLGPHRP